MYFVIDEISVDVSPNANRAGHLYVLVRFWLTKASHDAGDPAYLTNDFKMQLRKDVRRVVLDRTGRMKRADGVFVKIEEKTQADEDVGWEFESFEKDNEDIENEIVSNIIRYWKRAEANKWSGDHTGGPGPFRVNGFEQVKTTELVSRSTTVDPHGVRAKAAMIAGTGRDEGDIRNTVAISGLLKRDRARQ